MASSKSKKQSSYDYKLVIMVLFLCAFGLVMVLSSSSYVSAQANNGDGTYYFRHQGMIVAAGFVIMFIISKIDYHWYSKLCWLVYAGALLCQLAVYTPLGVVKNGARRWIGYGSYTIQPAEICKIAVILTLAVLFSKCYKQRTKPQLWRVAIIITLIPTVIIALENLSSAIIIAGIAVVMAFLIADEKWPFIVGAIAIAGVIILAYLLVDKLLEWKLPFLTAYRLRRILIWKNPSDYASDGGYQILQGLYAIGSGGLFGKGLGNSIQKLGFVPEAQNDMIFSIICEELGLFGAICVILMFVYLLSRLYDIAKKAADRLGFMICAGLFAQISIQVILNIAVVTGVIPNTGVTLPFISYGGTSILFLMAEMGMALGVSDRGRLEE